MSTKTFAIAASLVLSLSSAAFAQTAAGGGSAEGNMNNPGSVKSNSEKGMERSTGSTTGITTGSVDGVSGRDGGSGSMGGGTGSSANTGVGLGNQGATQAPRR